MTGTTSWERRLSSLLILFLSAICITTAHAGQIVGTVTTPGGDPVENVYVVAADYSFMNAQGAYTASDGSYTINNLPDDDYQVIFYGTEACSSEMYEVYYDADTPLTHVTLYLWEADWVSLIGGVQDPPSVDVVLDCTGSGTTGSITGKMYQGSNPAAAGAGLSGRVDVYDENHILKANVLVEDTDDGDYTVNNLEPGDYKLFFDADTNYISQWHYASPPATGFPPGDFCSATLVTVSADATTTVNEQLLPGATISGTVTEAGTGTQLIGVTVSVFSETYPSVQEAAYTDVDGSYTVSGLPPGSDYKLRFSPPSTLHVVQWGSDKYDLEHADPISAPSPTPLDVQLAPSSSLSGTVTDEVAPNNPIPLALVHAELTDPVKGTFSAVDTTDLNGDYTINGLPARAGWKVHFLDALFGYIGEWYNNKYDRASADPVTVPSSGLNAHLALGGCISGKVTLPTSVSEVTVEVYNDAFSSVIPIATSTTDGTGNYTVTGVPLSSENKVRFFVESQEGSFCSPTSTCYVNWYPDKVPVTTASTTSCTTGINTDLVSCGSISGTVTEANTSPPIEGVAVEVSSVNLGDIATGTTDTEGHYTIPGLPEGSTNTVTFTAAGYKDQVHTDIVISTTLDAALEDKTTGSVLAAIFQLLLL